MNDISYNKSSLLSDEALEQRIGHFIKKHRQRKSMTQDELAKAASISRSTLSLLERGETGNLSTLIQLLRVLDQLYVLNPFHFQEQTSPLAQAKMEKKERQRVKKSTSSNQNTAW